MVLRGVYGEISVISIWACQTNSSLSPFHFTLLNHGVLGIKSAFPAIGGRIDFPEIFFSNLGILAKCPPTSNTLLFYLIRIGFMLH